MRKKRLSFKTSVFIAMYLLLISPLCFGDHAAAVTMTPSPAHDAVGVPVTTTISVTFSEVMDESTLNADTFFITTGAGYDSGTVTGDITYNDKTATFTPAANLGYLAHYDVTITSDVTDSDGNALSGDYKWSFTTAYSDIPYPWVTSTHPAEGDAGASVTDSIRITFSDTMDCTTFDTNTFFVTTGTGYEIETISGTVECLDNTATFIPATALTSETDYEAKVTADVKNINKKPLLMDYAWSFATGNADGTRPAVTSVSPDDGETVADLDTAVLVTFSEDMNDATITDTTFKLTEGSDTISGSITYDDKTATFKPAESLKYDTTYTVTITTEVADQAGNTLESEKTWSFATISDAPTILSTHPETGSSGAYLNTAIVVTFSEAVQNVNDQTFSIRDMYGTGISGEYVFSSENTVMTFQPHVNLEPGTSYIVTITNSVEDLAGNPLKETTWSFETGSAAQPEITMAYPSDTATDMSVDTVIWVGFSELMEPFDKNAFFIKKGTGPDAELMTGEVLFYVDGANFMPAASLEPNTTYSVTITTDVRSQAGIALEDDHSWTFTTASETIPPVVTWTYPGDGFVNVAVDEMYWTGFSQYVDPSSITENTVSITDGSNTINDMITLHSGNMISFTPETDLAPDTTYAVTLTGIKNRSGIAMTNDHTWTFTTINPNAPEVISTLPDSDASDVAINAPITATFSKEMDESSVITAFELENGSGELVDGTVSHGDNVATFAPTGDLNYGETYTAVITTAAKDLTDIFLTSEKRWSFTIASQGCGAKGDLSGDARLGINDAVLALQVCAGIPLSQSICQDADVNGDEQIGMEETLHILQAVSQMP